jgi:outer membrane protein assembly factor BamA
MGRALVKGNSKTQDKVILRELNAQPGQLYNSAEVADATDRLKGTGYFTSVNIAPVGEEPDTRDVLAEVTEGRTASFNLGAGISSNGGLAGEVSYEQRNFDIGNWPSSWKDAFSDHTLTGAGQNFRAYVAPSTTGSSGGIRFIDPYLFDQPYIFSNELYYVRRIREAWDESRGGDRASIGKRLNRNTILSLNARAEDVEINNIQDESAVPPIRAVEVLDAEGHTTVTGLGLSLRYDTTNKGAVRYKGVIAQMAYERIGGLGGQVYMDKFTGSFDTYITLNDDLFDRKTVLALHTDAGYINDLEVPIYEAFYAGGMGTIRGFRFRGVSPRGLTSLGALSSDPIGGNFMWLNSAEMSYPIYTDIIRGVLFVDSGTVDRGTEIGTYRVAVGFGFRIIFPFAQQAPLAIDFGFPVVKDSTDDEQLVSFSFGITY